MAVLAVICLSKARHTDKGDQAGTLLLKSVFDPVMSNRALDDITEAAQAKDDLDDLAVQALTAELAYFVASYTPPQIPGEQLWNVEELLEDGMPEPRFRHVYDRFQNHRDELAEHYQESGRALGVAKTIKDSLEELMNLPDWLKRMLKVLNELLKIV